MDTYKLLCTYLRFLIQVVVVKNADCSVVQVVQVEPMLKNSLTLLGKYQASKYIGLAFLVGVHPASSVNLNIENITLNCVY